MKFQIKESKNGVNRTGTTSCEGAAPDMYGVPDRALGCCHQETDQTK